VANIEDVHRRLIELLRELIDLNTVGVTIAATEAKQDDIIVLLQQLIENTENKGVTSQIVVSASASSVSLVPSQVDRVEALVTNNTDKDMWITFGSAALLEGNGTKLSSNGVILIDRTDEQIFGIWEAGATGNAIIQHIF